LLLIFNPPNEITRPDSIATNLAWQVNIRQRIRRCQPQNRENYCNRGDFDDLNK
jgi:hypothetical protein